MSTGNEDEGTLWWSSFCSPEFKWQTYFAVIGGMLFFMQLNCMYLALLALFHFVLANVTWIVLIYAFVVCRLRIKIRKLESTSPVEAQVVKTKASAHVGMGRTTSFYMFAWVRLLDDIAEDSEAVREGSTYLVYSAASQAWVRRNCPNLNARSENPSQPIRSDSNVNDDNDWSTPPGSHLLTVSTSDEFVVGSHLSVHPLRADGLAGNVSGYFYLPHQRKYYRQCLLDLLKLGPAVVLAVPVFHFLVGTPCPFVPPAAIEQAANNSWFCFTEDGDEPDCCTISSLVYSFYILFVVSSIAPTVWIGIILYRKLQQSETQRNGYVPVTTDEPSPDEGDVDASTVPANTDALSLDEEGVVASAVPAHTDAPSLDEGDVDASTAPANTDESSPDEGDVDASTAPANTDEPSLDEGDVDASTFPAKTDEPSPDEEDVDASTPEETEVGVMA